MPIGVVLPSDRGEAARRRAAELGMSPEEYLAALVDDDLAPEAAALPDDDRRRLGDLALQALDAGEPPQVADDAFWQEVWSDVREGPRTGKPDAV